MIKADQNRIQTTVLNFRYKSKAAAVRSNILIESIFTQHILPELTNAVSATIPEEVVVELSKLEIDIGHIDESVLKMELAGRIAGTLAKALPNSIKHEINSHSAATFDHSKAHDFLTGALEAYLSKGYFPSWVDPALTVEDCVLMTLRENKTGLLQMLLKHCTHDHAARRLVQGISAQLLDSLLLKMLPVNGAWVLEYKRALITVKKELGLPQLGQNEFISNLNFFILRYVIKDSAVSFSRKGFSDSIAHEIIRAYHLDTRRLLRASKKIKGKKSAIANFRESVVEQQGKQRELAISELLNELEGVSKDTKKISADILRKQVLAALRDPNKKAFLFAKLSEAGATRMLDLTYPAKGKEFVELIKSFVSLSLPKAHTTSVTALVFTTMAYLSESAIREFKPEEYVLFLIYSSDLKVLKTINTTSFKRFVKERQLDIKNIRSVVESEQHYPEILNYNTILEKSSRESVSPEKIDTFKRSPKEAYFTIYGHKIVWHYLIYGQLAEEYHDLTKSDVQRIFQDLLHQKDIFLSGLLRKYKNTEKLIERLEALYAPAIYEEAGVQIPPELLVGSQKIQGYLKQLFSFFPLQFPAKVDTHFWKKLVLRFTLRGFVAFRNLSTKDFPPTFLHYMQQELKEINSEELLSSILDRMKSSGSKELKELGSIWDGSDLKLKEVKGVFPPAQNSYEREEDKAAGMWEKVNYYSSLLRFYVQKEFLPWWAGAQTFTEMLQQLIKDSRVDPKMAKELFVELYCEQQLLETLIPLLPIPQTEQLMHLIPESGSVRAKMASILQQFKGKAAAKSVQKDDVIAERTSDKDIVSAQLPGLEAKQEHVWFRSLYHLEDKEILGNWEKENPEGAGRLKEYLALAPYFYLRGLSPIRWRGMVYKFGLAFFGDKPEKKSADFHREFLGHLEKNYRNINWPTVLSAVYKITQKTGLKPSEEFPVELRKIIIREQDPVVESSNDSKKENDPIFEDAVTGGAKIFNAGLILLWPFLTRFFEHLSLLENGEFKDEKGKYKAAYLLQYLVYNTVDFQEGELVLNKVLTGLAPQHHLSPFVALSREEKDLAHSLLGGFISNWEKVKASTPEAIQETFLQRAGLMHFKADRILLKVDKKGVDVLLSSIPWNISLVKLPWMEKPLYVEWQ